MAKNIKKKFKPKKERDIAKEELKSLEDLPLVGGLFKGLGKFVELVEKVEEAGGEIKITETREPIVDVFDEKDHILVVAELPGVLEESIKLDFKGDILILEAGDEKRKYSKEILLPAKVDFEQKETNFKNGILEIKLKKI